MKVYPRILVLAALLAMIISASAHAAPTGAQNVVKNFYSQLVATMKQGESLGFDGRYKKLASAVQGAFNLPLMTRMAVSSSWSGASEKEQNDLVAAFSKYSISTYATRFASYDGEEFVVVGEKISGKDVVVETLLKPKEGDHVQLNYLMRPDEGGKYRIVDVYMNGTISELATRRSEFSSIARREGISALVNSLSEKSRQMASATSS
ncbi:MAG: ABC transporter substrate-binding protein [Alphaproteobacteria bacterium]|nr:ABC transporter substrate-binding protein [Alphaproteobacteria bacterium]